MKHQVLFSLKNDEEIFMNVVCCSCDWRFKGQIRSHDTYVCREMKQNSLSDAKYLS